MSVVKLLIYSVDSSIFSKPCVTYDEQNSVEAQKHLIKDTHIQDSRTS